MVLELDTNILWLPHPGNIHFWKICYYKGQIIGWYQFENECIVINIMNDTSGYYSVLRLPIDKLSTTNADKMTQLAKNLIEQSTILFD